MEGQECLLDLARQRGVSNARIVVQEELAYLYYVPKESAAGFCSQGLFADLLPGEKTTFVASKDGEEMQVLNEFVISWPEALAAAREFFSSKDLPPSIEWLEL